MHYTGIIARYYVIDFIATFVYCVNFVASQSRSCWLNGTTGHAQPKRNDANAYSLARRRKLVIIYHLRNHSFYYQHNLKRYSLHYGDVIMGTIASQSTSSPLFTQTFIQTQIKENIKAPRHWPLCGEFTCEFPAQMVSDAENVSIWWRHHAWKGTTWNPNNKDRATRS